MKQTGIHSWLVLGSTKDVEREKTARDAERIIEQRKGEGQGRRLPSHLTRDWVPPDC